MSIRSIILAGAALAVVGTASVATAGGVITNGLFSVGIGANGELYDNGTGVGFKRMSDGYDPLAPGNPRDSWGITTNMGSAWADQNDFGTSGITGTSYVSLGTNASATSTTNVGVTVQHQYSFTAQPNILMVKEVVTNTSGSALTFSFQRNWDLDVAPTAFNENSYGHVGVNPKVLDSSYYGFENPDPSVPYAFSCAPNCNQLGDLGGGIKVGTWTLAAGQAMAFDYYYGINLDGTNSDFLTAQAFLVDSNYNILTQSSENGLYPSHGANSGLIGFNTVPEPASWALMIVGFGMVGASMRRRTLVVTA